MKRSRQEKIMELVQAQDIENQGQLIEALEKEGYPSTQATVSRDIKELRLVKELTALGRYRYAPASRDEVMNHEERLRTIFRESVTSFTCAQNIVVIKTLPGLASAACSAIDRMSISDLAGTLAGDDTAFLAMKDDGAAQRFCNEIKNLLL